MAKLTHSCSKEAEFAEIKTQVKDLVHIIKGNSKPGLSQTVPLLVDGLARFETTLQEFSKAISGFQKFQMDYEIRAEIKMKDQLEKEKKEQDKKLIVDAKLERSKRDSKWLVGILITLALGIGGLYFTMRKDNREAENYKRGLIMETLSDSSTVKK